MKGKNLERTVILGLLLSTSIYGTAWAEFTISEDGKTLTATENLDGYKDKGNLSNFDTIKITTGSTGGLKTWGGKYNLKDVYVTTTGNGSNVDGVHLAKYDSVFYARTYVADINTNSSDALNLSRDAENVTAEIGEFSAVVKNGSGIRANGSVNGNIENPNLAKVTVNGNAYIEINGNASSDILTAYIFKNPLNLAGVWAGSDEDFRIYGQTTKGKGVVYLNGNTQIVLNGKGTNYEGKVYGLLTGKNGYIKANNIDVIAKKDYSYGIAVTNKNISYGNDDSVNNFGSTIELNGKVNNIVMNGNNSYAIYAVGVDVNGNSNTIKSGEEGIGGLNIKGNILAEDSGAIDLTINNDKIIDEDNNVNENYVTVEGDVLAKSGGTVNMAVKNTAGITGNIEAVGADSKINIGGISAVDGQSVMRANNNDSGVTHINITGNIQAANGATIDLSLGDGAYFKGRVDDYKDADNKNTWNNIDHGSLFDEDFVNDNKVNSSGKVSLTLGNNATWSVTEQSWATTVNTDKSIIDLTNGNNKNYAVHIGTLNGDAKFIVNLDPNTEDAINNGNMIYVYDGTNANKLDLQINNERDVLTGLADGERLRFATVANAGGGFGDTYVVRGRGVINSGFSIEYEDYDTTDKEENYKYNGGDNFGDSKPGSGYIDNIYGTVDESQNVYFILYAIPAKTQVNLTAVQPLSI